MIRSLIDRKFERRLAGLVNSGQRTVLRGGRKGVEKESLRVTPAGEISQAPHPRALGAPLDLLLVRKIGASVQPELALGAVIDGGAPVIIRNADVIVLTGTTDEEFDAICKRELAEIERRRARYLAGRPAHDPAGKVAIVVDDGIATGATMRAALRATRQRKPERLVLAVPVAPPDTIASLRPEADDVVCLEMPEQFGAIGYFYDNFDQLNDQDVIDILKRFPA